MRLRVAIVDDEELARKLLREYLSAFEDVDIVAECANGFEALELVGREVGVIFVTAYDKYALRAFEVHAVDYLLKPFSPERLREALQHARSKIGKGETIPVAALTAAA